MVKKGSTSGCTVLILISFVFKPSITSQTMLKVRSEDQWTAFWNLVPTLPIMHLRHSDITGGNLSDCMQLLLEPRKALYYSVHIRSSTPQMCNVYNCWSYPLTLWEQLSVQPLLLLDKTSYKSVFMSELITLCVILLHFSWYDLNSTPTS